MTRDASKYITFVGLIAVTQIATLTAGCAHHPPPATVATPVPTVSKPLAAMTPQQQQYRQAAILGRRQMARERAALRAQQQKK